MKFNNKSSSSGITFLFFLLFVFLFSNYFTKGVNQQELYYYEPKDIKYSNSYREEVNYIYPGSKLNYKRTILEENEEEYLIYNNKPSTHRKILVPIKKGSNIDIKRIYNEIVNKKSKWYKTRYKLLKKYSLKEFSDFTYMPDSVPVEKNWIEISSEGRLYQIDNADYKEKIKNYYISNNPKTERYVLLKEEKIKGLKSLFSSYKSFSVSAYYVHLTKEEANNLTAEEIYKRTLNEN